MHTVSLYNIICMYIDIYYAVTKMWLTNILILHTPDEGSLAKTAVL